MVLSYELSIGKATDREQGMMSGWGRGEVEHPNIFISKFGAGQERSGGAGAENFTVVLV